MANPKRKISKARTRSRRAHDALTTKSLSNCSNCHEPKMPHRVCLKCGHYKGKEIIEVKDVF